MKKLILTDEYELLAGYIVSSKKADLYKNNLLYFADTNFLCDYLLRASSVAFLKKGDILGVGRPYYLLSGTEDEYRRKTLNAVQETVKTAEISEAAGLAAGNTMVFADCIGGLPQRETTLAKLRELFSVLAKQKNHKVVASVFLPAFPAFPNGISSLAEREFDYYISKKVTRTPEIDYYLELTDVFRAAQRSGVDLTVIRFSDVFAPDRNHSPNVNVAEIVKKSFDAQKVVIDQDAFATTVSLTYVRYACKQAYALLDMQEISGHVFNGLGTRLTVARLLELLHECCPQKLGLSADIDKNGKMKNYALDTLKISRRKMPGNCKFTNALWHMISYCTGEEYANDENVAFYQGKIDIIQKLELEILQEIDRICRKHSIKYFLAGGTLLGSVRGGAPIEWDDDLDIGMLREDYEKFRKVCEEELDDRFLFSGVYNGSGNHYTIEKIRMKNTWFSTRFSSKNVFEDGVFVDLLIYDRTTENKFFQKLQVYWLAALTTLIYIRWYNTPRKNYHYGFSRKFLPLMRLIPMKVYHKLFDWVACRYRRKKNTTLLIDTVGKKLMDGPLPITGLEEVEDVEFAGVTAMTPTDPVPYLNYAYGPNYMEKPSLSNRRCPHNFARIDLGAYVFGETHPKFRAADLRGELWETEDDETNE